VLFQSRKADIQILDRAGISVLFQSRKADIQNLGSSHMGRSCISVLLF
jgi:hypothetical protein